MVVYLLHSMEDLYVFSYSDRFLGFREVLRKQEVYGGTFPIPLETNLMEYWFDRITFCTCLIRIRTIPQL